MRWEAGHGAITEGSGRDGVNVRRVCGELGMSRQNYYQRRRERQRQAVDEDFVVELVRNKRQRHPQMGTRKLHKVLESEWVKAGVKMGRDRLFELLGDKDLLVKRQRSEFPRTTNSYHVLPVFRNRIKDLKPTPVLQKAIFLRRCGERISIYG